MSNRNAPFFEPDIASINIIDFQNRDKGSDGKVYGQVVIEIVGSKGDKRQHICDETRVHDALGQAQEIIAGFSSSGAGPEVLERAHMVQTVMSAAVRMIDSPSIKQGRIAEI